MATTLLTVKIDEKDKKKAQKLAKQLGFSLSAVMKAYLKEFLREKRVNVQLEEDLELTDWAKEELRLSAEDVKAGRVMTFKDHDDELRYLDKVIKDAKRARKN